MGEGETKEGEKKEGEKKEEEKKKEPEKKYEWVEVKKMRKRTKKTELKITTAGAMGLSPSAIQKLMDQESAIQADMREIIETDARRNDLEGYIFNMRDKISAGSEYGEYITDADRGAFNSELNKAEDWLYDNMEATKAQCVEKLDELKKTGDSVAWRFKENSMRPEWVGAVQGTIKNYRIAAQEPGEKFGHIAAD